MQRAGWGLILALLATQAQANDPTLERIQRTRTLTVAYVPDNQPFAMKRSDGSVAGYAIELCQRVAERVATELKLPSVQVRYVETNFDELVKTVADGSADMECGATTNTLERQKHVTFSLTTFVTSARMMVSRASPIKEFRDLKRDTRVVVLRGTTGAAALAAKAATLQLQPRVIAVDSPLEAVKLLDSQAADVYVDDDVALWGLRPKFKTPADWVVVGMSLTIEPYGLVLPKGSPAFVALVDGVLRDTYASGAIQRIYSRWFDSPEFQLPMSALTRETFRWPNKVTAARAF